MENLEVWKEVEGYKDYQISNLGRVKSLKFNKEKILSESFYRYKSVIMSQNGKYRPESIHRLIAKAFIPNPENKPQVNHVNGIKADNRIENLEWCTNSENQKHAYKNGLQKAQKGILSHRYGIPNARVKKVFHKESGKIYDSCKLAADDFKISSNTVYRQAKGTRKNKLGFYFLN